MFHCPHVDAEAECVGCLCEGFAESHERFVRSLAIKLRNDDHLSPFRLGSRKSATICAFPMDFLARHTSLEKGESVFAFMLSSSPTPPPPRRPFISAPPRPFAQQLSQRALWLCGQAGMFLAVDHSGCRERCLCILGQRGLLLSPRAALALTGPSGTCPAPVPLAGSHLSFS